MLFSPVVWWIHRSYKTDLMSALYLRWQFGSKWLLLKEHCSFFPVWNVFCILFICKFAGATVKIFASRWKPLSFITHKSCCRRVTLGVWDHQYCFGWMWLNPHLEYVGGETTVNACPHLQGHEWMGFLSLRKSGIRCLSLSEAFSPLGRSFFPLRGRSPEGGNP